MSYQLPATVSTGTDLVPVIEDPQEGLRRSFKAGLITIGLLLFGLFALAAIIGTQGAVVGAGEVTVEFAGEEDRPSHRRCDLGGLCARGPARQKGRRSHAPG